MACLTESWKSGVPESEAQQYFRNIQKWMPSAAFSNIHMHKPGRQRAWRRGAGGAATQCIRQAAKRVIVVCSAAYSIIVASEKSSCYGKFTWQTLEVEGLGESG